MQKDLHPEHYDLVNFLQFIIFKAVLVVNYVFLLLDLLREQHNTKQLSLLVSYACPRLKGTLKPAGSSLCTLRSNTEQAKQGVLLMGCLSQRRERLVPSHYLWLVLSSPLSCCSPVYGVQRRGHLVTLVLTSVLPAGWQRQLKTGSEGGR